MAVFTGQTGSVSVAADELGNPGFPTAIANRAHVTRWTLSSTRNVRDVTPKVQSQAIVVPNEVDAVADLAGFGYWGGGGVDFRPIEWFGTAMLLVVLLRVPGDFFVMNGYTEQLVHEVAVDQPIRWQARVRVIGEVTLT